MSCMHDMTPWSLRTVVTPDTVRIMKNVPNFLKEDKICYKMVYKTLYFG